MNLLSGLLARPGWQWLSRPRTWALLTLGVLAVRWLVMYLNQKFSIDEIEHIHSAWLILQGDVPYRDFFQHHNPLFWYTLLPVLALVGETADILIVLRLLLMVLACGTLYLVYRLGREASKSELGGWVAAVLLLCSCLYLDSVAETRPDPLQVFFGTLAAFGYIQYLRHHRPRDLILAGFSVSVSFLFLQKAVFMGMALVLAAGYEALIRRSLPWRDFLKFLLAGALPLLAFAGVLGMTGLWSDYVFFSYIMNINKNNPWWSFIHFFTRDNYHLPYWALSTLAVGLAFLRPGTSRTSRVLAWFVVWQIIFLLFVKYASKHYLLQWITLCTPLIGWMFVRYFGPQGRWGRHGRAAAIAVGAISVIVAYTYPLVPNRPQLDKIQYVLDHTDSTDRVYDGHPEYNLFRRDLHYFWYSLGPFQNLWVYQQLTGQYLDYNIRALILEKRPKFISEWQIHVHEGETRRRYKATPFPALYQLRPEFDRKEQHE